MENIKINFHDNSFLKNIVETSDEKNKARLRLEMSIDADTKELIIEAVSIIDGEIKYQYKNNAVENVSLDKILDEAFKPIKKDGRFGC